MLPFKESKCIKRKWQYSCNSVYLRTFVRWQLTKKSMLSSFLSCLDLSSMPHLNLTVTRPGLVFLEQPKKMISQKTYPTISELQKSYFNLKKNGLKIIWNPNSMTFGRKRNYTSWSHLSHPRIPKTSETSKLTRIIISFLLGLKFKVNTFFKKFSYKSWLKLHFSLIIFFK